MHISMEFIATSFIVAISPGSGAIYTIVAGLTRGLKGALIAATGCTLGVIPHLLMAIFGLAVIFHTSEFAFTTLKILGVVYLLYMAWISLRANETVTLEAKAEDVSPLKVIINAILLNLLNPKLSLFFLAFLPQFISTQSSIPMTEMLILSLVFMLITQIVFMLYGAFSTLVRERVLENPNTLKWLHRCFAIGFVGLSVRLLFTSR